MQNGMQKNPDQAGSKNSKIISMIKLTDVRILNNFFNVWRNLGYEIKRGKYIAFRAPDQKRFTRAKTLGDEFTEEAIRLKISKQISVKKSTYRRTWHYQEPSIPTLIDIQKKLEEGKGVGYEQWAKIFNLKAFASSVFEAYQMDLYGIEEIAEHTQKLTDDFYGVSDQMKEIEEQMRQNKILKSAIINYGKTNRIYKQYKASGKSKDFYEKHREELERHRAARKVFDQYGSKDFPSVKELDERFRGLEQRRKSMYEDYKVKRTEMQKWQNIQSNLEYGFRKVEKEKHHALER